MQILRKERKFTPQILRSYTKILKSLMGLERPSFSRQTANGQFDFPAIREEGEVIVQ